VRLRSQALATAWNQFSFILFIGSTVMSRRTGRRGFTLVELLVVIAIIGILVALLLPAIQAAREAARRTQCNNNLKNIALGLQNYHDSYKTLPMGASGRRPIGGNSPLGDLGPSWYVSIAPFMEQRNIYDKLMSTQRPGAGVGDNEFRYGTMPPDIQDDLRNLVPDYMRCPSSPLPDYNTQTGNCAMATYTGISGGTDIDPAGTDEDGNPLYPAQQWGIPTTTQIYKNVVPGRDLSRPCPNDLGVWTSSGMLPPVEQLGYADCSDGLSNTMVVGEQSDYLQDVDVNVSAKYRGDPGWTGATGTHRGWISGTTANNFLGTTATQFVQDTFNINTVRYKPDLKKVVDGAAGINGGGSSAPGCSQNRRGGRGANNPLQSPHPGGILVAMCDGSVQFIAGTVDLAIVLRLAIRDDGQQIKLDN
jgi:prepilin-type N-terminal cleavage/methylation domain-containing protein